VAETAKKVEFTKHAYDKFELLRKGGVSSADPNHYECEHYERHDQQENE
jgi:hypothetical protein